ncbi:MAG: hypothetical protein B7C54_02390 [Acidimicrobiales bacterium mtb01]|nr:hypothetical protein [Actinomycetota bacterium]TEX47931.1 MAG: hypothetical protein B7C54_02390 [Acidimicrobiales bacterium mtb01]
MIVSTTLTGSNENIIGDAIRSVVDHVDRCLVIDTGATDRSIDVAREVAGDKLVVREFTWVDDFAAARNFALDCALEMGGVWAITVDTDERMQFSRGTDLRALLAASDVDVLNVEYFDGLYSKERIFRLPRYVRWDGPIHEGVLDMKVDRRSVLREVRFFELAKSAEQMQSKFERDLKILLKHTQKNPTVARWFYYLGATYESLGRHKEAIRAYEKCSRLPGWAEEAAFASFRAANCWCVLQDWRAAVKACVEGLAHRPATAELAWLAGWACYQAGRHEDAIAWSHMAIANGRYAGSSADDGRVGFRELRGLFEGPYDVLRFAYRAIGDIAAAERAEGDFQVALEARSSAGR